MNEPLSDLLRLLTLQDSNTRVVMIGAGVLGFSAGAVGALAVLRKRALAGDAVAHASLPGVCVAWFIVGDRNFTALLLGALVFGILAAALIAMVRSLTRIKEDAATAIAIGSLFGLGIALSRLIQNRATGDRAGLDSFLFGKAASMLRSDAILISLVAAGAVVVVSLFFKEFKLLCFDREYAAVVWGGRRGGLGWRVQAIDLLLMGLVAVCTVVGLPAVGVVLMVGLLVIPPAAARFWTDRFGVMLVISAMVGLVSGIAGTALSATLPTPAGMLSRGWPTGPMITLVAAAVFVISLLLAPRRGVLAELIRRARMSRRIGVHHVLRWMYEQLESHGALANALGTAIQADGRAGSHSWSRAARLGLIAQDPDGSFRLTRYGLGEAARIVRTHRLWELFLTQEAAIASDHVHRDADEIEHVLPREVVARLEVQLREEGRLPRDESVPESVHRLAESGESAASQAGAKRGLP